MSVRQWVGVGLIALLAVIVIPVTLNGYPLAFLGDEPIYWPLETIRLIFLPVQFFTPQLFFGHLGEVAFLLVLAWLGESVGRRVLRALEGARRGASSVAPLMKGGWGDLPSDSGAPVSLQSGSTERGATSEGPGRSDSSASLGMTTRHTGTEACATSAKSTAATPFHLPLGLCVLGYLAAFLCWAQLFRWWALLVTGVVLVFVSWREGLAVPRDLWAWARARWPVHWRAQRPWSTPLRIAGWGILLYLVLLSLVFSFAPPHQSDALRYHLAVPKVYIQNGGFVYLPHSAFSNFPFTIEMLYGVALMFCSGSAARGVHWLFLVIALFAIYHFGKRYRNADTGLLAALLFATIPYVALIASWAFIEVALAAMVFLSVYALILWCEAVGLMNSAGTRMDIKRPEPRPPLTDARTAQWLFILSAGFSMGLKYTSVFVTAFLFLVVLVLAIRRIWTAPWRQIIVTFALAGVVASPWYVKNLVVTGNPVFPLANGIFQADDWSKVEAELYYYHAGMKGNLNQMKLLMSVPYFPTFLDRAYPVVKDQLDLPLRAVAARRAEHVTWEVGPYESFRLAPEYFGDWPIGWAPLVLFPALLLFRRMNRLMLVLVLMVLLLYVFWSWTYRDTRFLLPALSLIAVIVAIGMHDLWKANRPMGALIGLLACAGIVYAGLQSLQTAYGGQNVLPVVSGQISEDEFLASRINSYRAMQWMNENAEGTVILHAEHRPYYLDLPYIGSDFFNTPVVWKWAKEGGAALDEKMAQGDWLFYNEEEESLIINSYPLYLLLSLDESSTGYVREAQYSGVASVAEDVIGTYATSQAYQEWRYYLYGGMNSVPEHPGKISPLESDQAVSIYRLKEDGKSLR